MQIALSGGLLAVLYMSVVGTVVGVLQWPALRGHVPETGWWVPASVAGAVTAGPTVGVVAAVAVGAGAGVDAARDSGSLRGSCCLRVARVWSAGI